jgi:hypothetical protein
MLIFAMDGPLCWLRIDTTSLALMMPSGAVHPITGGNAHIEQMCSLFLRQPNSYCIRQKFAVGPAHEVAALQPAARGREPHGR